MSIVFIFSLNTIVSTTSSKLYAQELIVSITTDEFASDNYWSLYDGNTDQLVYTSQGKALIPNAINFDTVRYENSRCYRAVLYDTNQDGIEGGKWTLTIRGEEIAYDTQFDGQIEHYFGCRVYQSCYNSFFISPGKYQLPDYEYTWFRIRPDNDTYYAILTGGFCDTRLWLYDNCVTVHGDGPAGAIAYNFDYDDKLAGIPQIRLFGGRDYYIRVGRGNCSDPRVSLELKDLGLRNGCMDPNACNFDPFANLDGECIYEDCAPDLVVSQSALIESISLDTISVEDPCLVEEGCLTGYGKREVVRFTTEISNIGTTDYIVGEAITETRHFSQLNCHEHWHYLGYAEYLLYDGGGQPQPIGFKNGFCALDFTCEDNDDFKYTCDYMGISTGCTDTYYKDLPCQWMDLTDVEDGDYTLVLRVNWNRLPDHFGREETNYDNNWAQACINIDRSSGPLKLKIIEDCPYYKDCMGITYGVTEEDCEGVCGGSAHYGDINQDGSVSIEDLDIYRDYISSGYDIENLSCFDLSGDRRFTILDYLLLDDCILSNANLDESDPSHAHCEFPYYIYSDEDSSHLMLGDLNDAQGSFDLLYTSERGFIGMDLFIQGAKIDSFSINRNLADPDSLWVITVDDRLSFAVLNAKSIERTLDFDLLGTVYFSKVDSEICIDRVDQIFNAQFEISYCGIDGTCLTASTTSIEDRYFNDDQIEVYPNPNKGEFYINNLSKNHFDRIELLNLHGQSVYEKNIYNTANSTSINIGHQLPVGVYLLRLRSSHQSKIKRIIIE